MKTKRFAPDLAWPGHRPHGLVNLMKKRPKFFQNAQQQSSAGILQRFSKLWLDPVGRSNAVISETKADRQRGGMNEKPPTAFGLLVNRRWLEIQCQLQMDGGSLQWHFLLMESRGERSRCEVETNSVPSELPCVTSLALSLHIWLDY